MPKKTDYPMALSPPSEPLTTIGSDLFAEGIAASQESPRGRIIQPLHKHAGDILQRMLNTLQPRSYIRPHRHANHRGESLVVLSGVLLYLTFDETGEVQEALRLESGSSALGVDTDGGVWHCFMALEPNTVLFEIKPGPYDAMTDKEFAPWAPEEYTSAADAYLDGLLQYATTSR